MFIPEFVGRLPVCGVLHELDESALIKILRNQIMRWSIISKKVDFDNFSSSSLTMLKAVANHAVNARWRARLMIILEELLLDCDVTLPSQKR